MPCVNYETFNLNYIMVLIDDGCNFVSSKLLIKKDKAMGNLLYIIAVILIIGWAIGFIGFHAGGIIHVLLAIAVIAVIVRLLQGKRAI
jgi:hypothetical protein